MEYYTAIDKTATDKNGSDAPKVRHDDEKGQTSDIFMDQELHNLIPPKLLNRAKLMPGEDSGWQITRQTRRKQNHLRDCSNDLPGTDK